MDATRLLDRPAGAGAALDRKSASATPEQLRSLAAQFESLLLTQMLSTMRSSMFGDENEGASGFGQGPLADALYSELGMALSQSGGFGLSESMLGPLLRESGGAAVANAPSAATAALAAAGLPLAPLSPSPSPPPVSSPFGWRRDPLTNETRFHKGADIAMPAGEPVPAARGGRVTFAGEMAGYGLTVLVDHGNDISTRYAHLSSISVEQGAAVAEGQTLALSGATGRATGPHLHIELLEKGIPVDPVGRLSLTGLSVRISD